MHLMITRRYAGSALAAVIAGKADDIKPALLKAIEAEMGKVLTLTD